MGRYSFIVRLLHPLLHTGFYRGFRSVILFAFGVMVWQVLALGNRTRRSRPMARPLRVEFPGACYHVINRGNFRFPVFEENRDRELILEKLVGFSESFGEYVRTLPRAPQGAG